MLTMELCRQVRTVSVPDFSRSCLTEASERNLPSIDRLCFHSWKGSSEVN
jgi:hypothetical protein